MYYFGYIQCSAWFLLLSIYRGYLTEVSCSDSWPRPVLYSLSILSFTQKKNALKEIAILFRPHVKCALY